MILPVNEQYRISSDSLQWIVERRRTPQAGRKSKRDWDAIAYYGSLRSAVASLGDRLLRECEATSLGEAIDASERIASALERALAGHHAVASRLDTLEAA